MSVNDIIAQSQAIEINNNNEYKALIDVNIDRIFNLISEDLRNNIYVTRDRTSSLYLKEHIFAHEVYQHVCNGSLEPSSKLLDETDLQLITLKIKNLDEL